MYLKTHTDTHTHTEKVKMVLIDINAFNSIFLTPRMLDSVVL